MGLVKKLAVYCPCRNKETHHPTSQLSTTCRCASLPRSSRSRSFSRRGLLVSRTHHVYSQCPEVVDSLTLWYPRHKLQYRIGLFFGAASVSGAFSGLLAFGISYMSGTRGLLGWSWIFVGYGEVLDGKTLTAQYRSWRGVRLSALEFLHFWVRCIRNLSGLLLDISFS